MYRHERTNHLIKNEGLGAIEAINLARTGMTDDSLNALHSP